MSKKIELWVVLLVVWLGLIFTLLFGWRAGAYGRGSERFASISKLIYSVSQFPSQVVTVILDVSKPSGVFVQNRWPERVGFKETTDSILPLGVQSDDGYLLVSSSTPETNLPSVKLIRISDQKILNTWQLEKELLDEIHDDATGNTRQNHYFRHPRLLPNGSIISTINGSELVTINRFSEVVWKADMISHHSVEMDSKGNIWHCVRNRENIYTDKLLDVASRSRDSSHHYYWDDAISCLNQAGEEIFRKSITTILIENGYRSLVFGASPIYFDPIHLNDIQPALNSSLYWEEGDLLVSIRNRSTVFLYRPSTNKIIWLKNGPWLHQHDVDFLDSSRIGVFSNNMLEGTNKRIMYEEVNTQFIFDFKSNLLTRPFDNAFLKAEIRTPSQGRSEILENGDLFVEETDDGRLLRIAQDSIVWEYTEPKDEEYTSRFNWSGYYSKNQIKEAIELFTKDEIYEK